MASQETSAVSVVSAHFRSLSSMSSLVSSRDTGMRLSQKKMFLSRSLILSTRRSSGYTMPVHVLSKLIHIATPDMTKLSCLCRVRFGSACELDSHDNSRLSPTENLKSEHVNSNIVQFTPPRQTRHRQDCFVVSGGRCELGISRSTPRCHDIRTRDNSSKVSAAMPPRSSALCRPRVVPPTMGHADDAAVRADLFPLSPRRTRNSHAPRSAVERRRAHTVKYYFGHLSFAWVL